MVGYYTTSILLYCTLQWFHFGRCQICGNFNQSATYFITDQYGCHMDVKGQSTSPGAVIQIYSPKSVYTGPNQLFYIAMVPSRPGYFLILNVPSKLAFDLGTGGLTQQIPTCSESQLFTSIPGNIPGTCYLSNSASCPTIALTSPAASSSCTGGAILNSTAGGLNTQQWNLQTTSRANVAPPPPCVNSVISQPPSPPPCPITTTTQLPTSSTTTTITTATSSAPTTSAATPSTSAILSISSESFSTTAQVPTTSSNVSMTTTEATSFVFTSTATSSISASSKFTNSPTATRLL